ncbi:MAG TPA: tetratricopeptide repeat protein [Candidatus Cloacimonadota bacterium]|nr:tetratricopeptide repeat protein [Candidatus Cloacimonadota bacterium]
MKKCKVIFLGFLLVIGLSSLLAVDNVEEVNQGIKIEDPQEKSLERMASEYATAGDSLFAIPDYAGAFVEYQNAYKTYEKAITDITPFDEELKKMANNLYSSATNAKMYDKAVVWGEKYLEFAPNDEAVVRNVATIYAVGLKQNEKSIEVWTKYDTANNANTAKLAIADRYSRMKEYEKSIIWYKKAYEQSKDADLFEKIADLYIKLKKNADAVKTYEDFLASNPSESDLFKTYKNLGTLYNKLKDVDKAILNFEKAIELNSDPQITLFLVSNYYDKKNYNKAINYANILISNNPNNADALYFRALSYYYNNDKNSAKTDFEKITSNPKYGKSASDFINLINQGR